jgi:hypothetical protein
MDPKYPIYIVSKGRWQLRHTSKALERMRVPYWIIVEEQEADQYRSVIDPSRVLILDPSYQARYATMDDLGLTKSTGPGPARNFAWDHSLAQGAARHWVLDDNIRTFYRLNQNLKIQVHDGVLFRWMEEFADRYANIALAGPNYEKFAPRRQARPPLFMNTRIYSCLLIQNDLPWRWRGRYNEDTDLSLRALKAGWCTVQFNAFLQEKITTQVVKGGNTQDFYEQEGTLAKSRMLARMHPDVASVVWRHHRWHHHVDYRPYQANQLLPAEGARVEHVVDGLRLVQLREIKSLELRKQLQALGGAEDGQG